MTEHTHHHEKLNTATGPGFEPITSVRVEGIIGKPKSIPERIDRILDRLEDANRRMVVIEDRLTLYEGKLGI